MEIMYLGIVFVVVILLLALRRPLYQAILGGLLATAALYRIPPGAIAQRTLAVFTDWSSLSVLLSLYLITLLQRILEARSQIRLAQQDLAGIFHDRRIDTVGAAFFIGLLPSAASMLLCADIVKEATDGYLDPKEQAFVTSWFRHIPESVLPTYTAVLLMLNLSGVETSRFILGMIVPVIVLMFLGYQTYLRRIPAETGTAKSQDRLADAIHLIGHLWPLLLILVLILVFHMQVVTSVLLSILLSLWAYKIRREELKRCLRSAFEAKMLVNTFLVLALKEFIDYTGVLLLLPDAMAGLPLPTYLIFGLLFFVATVISGSTGAIAMATPLAFASIPQGAPLMVYLMCMSHAASQISPTHVCLVVAADYFHVSLGDLVKKTLPIALAFCVLMTLYYQLLSSLLPLG